MPSSLKTRGIVLKRFNFGEADRVLTIFTERFGKVKAIAKGVRKINSKFSGHIEPFYVSDFILYPGKTFYIVTSVEVQNAYDNIHTDMQKASRAFYIAEVVDNFSREEERHFDVFVLLVSLLDHLENGDDDMDLVVHEAKILECFGFLPELSECIHCRGVLKQEEQNFWDHVEGGVLCPRCQNKFNHGQEINNNIIKVLRLIFSDNFKTNTRININSDHKKTAFEILERYTEGILERELKTKRFLK